MSAKLKKTDSIVIFIVDYGSIQFGNKTNGDEIFLDKSVNTSNLVDKDAKKTLTRKRKTPGKKG
jgi:hypothetical protein